MKKAIYTSSKRSYIDRFAKACSPAPRSVEVKIRGCTIDKPRDTPVDEQLEPMKVLLRVRPYNSNELEKTANDELMACIRVDSKRISICNPALLKTRHRDYAWKCFDFEFVAGEKHSNDTIYSEWIKPSIISACDGFDVSVLCYGVTGSGKSYTMFGESLERSSKGLILWAAEELLNFKAHCKDAKVKLEMSIYEIYNENIKDLSSQSPQALNLCEDQKKEVYIKDLNKFVIDNIEDINSLISKGISNRVKACTNKNLHSSRSHAVVEFSITVAADSHDSNSHQVKTSKLMMVDLAGSERLDTSEGAASLESSSIRKAEGSKINKSLLSLTNCILNLGDQKPFTNFRDSKLTRILKTTLSGNARTIMIGCVSKSSKEYDNTFNTLKYCSKATNIKRPCKANITQKTQAQVDQVMIKNSESSTLLKNILKPVVKIQEQQSHQGVFSEAKTVISKRESDTGTLVSVMLGMVSKKKFIEEEFRKGKMTSSDYFYAMAHYNELTIKLLNLMDASGSVQSSTNRKKRGLMHEILSKDDTIAMKSTLSLEYRNQDLSPTKKPMTTKAKRATATLPKTMILANSMLWKRNMEKFKTVTSSRLSPKKSRQLKSPQKDVVRNKSKVTEEVAKLSQARQDYRNFKNEMQVIHSMKDQINPTNPRETFEVSYKIESLIRRQQDNKFLLTTSQDTVMQDLRDYLRCQRSSPSKKPYFQKYRPSNVNHK